MPKLFILCGPPGAGKSTLAAAISKTRNDFFFLPNLTTRTRRPSDLETKLIFVSKAEFLKEQTNNNLYFSYRAQGNMYGIPRTAIKELSTHNAIAVIGDFKALKKVKKKLSAITIYVSSELSQIYERLLKPDGNAKDQETRKRRVETHLTKHKTKQDLFDHHIENNGTIEEAVQKLTRILDTYASN